MSTPQELRLPPVTASVGDARRFVAGCIENVRDSVVDRVILLVSELAANAVQHARSWFTVSVEVTPRIRVEVSDANHSGVRRQPGQPSDPTGRGLNIVALGSDAWGVVHHPNDGKTVWFEVDPTSSPAAPAVAPGGVTPGG